jgi:hypothetical protein
MLGETDVNQIELLTHNSQNPDNGDSNPDFIPGFSGIHRA